MTITLNGTSGITDADGGTVLSTADIASLAQAQAGTDNTTVMTPLRTAQEITALGGGMTLLGTLTTTSGTTQTLSGLNLAPYKRLWCVWDGVQNSSVSGGPNITFMGVTGLATLNNAPHYGDFVVDIATSVGFCQITPSVAASSSTTATVKTLRASITPATTSISIVAVGTSAAFVAGSVAIYGVR